MTINYKREKPFNNQNNLFYTIFNINNHQTPFKRKILNYFK